MVLPFARHEPAGRKLEPGLDEQRIHGQVARDVPAHGISVVPPGRMGEGIVHDLVDDDALLFVERERLNPTWAINQRAAVRGHRFAFPVRLGRQPQRQGGEESALGILAQQKFGPGLGNGLGCGFLSRLPIGRFRDNGFFLYQLIKDSGVG
jgi:hypothetical protein